MLRFGTLKIYSITRVISLTDIPLSGFDCIVKDNLTVKIIAFCFWKPNKLICVKLAHQIWFYLFNSYLRFIPGLPNRLFRLPTSDIAKNKKKIILDRIFLSAIPNSKFKKQSMPKVCPTFVHVCPDFNFFAKLVLSLNTQFCFFEKREVGTPKFEIQKTNYAKGLPNVSSCLPRI